MDKKILLLGIYHTPYFLFFKNTNKYLIYDDFLKSKDTLHLKTPISLIEYAIHVCDEIHFLLDEIQVPIDPYKSMTCQELVSLFKIKKNFNKTTFFLNREIIPVNKVIEIYKLNQYEIS